MFTPKRRGARRLQSRLPLGGPDSLGLRAGADSRSPGSRRGIAAGVPSAALADRASPGLDPIRTARAAPAFRGGDACSAISALRARSCLPAQLGRPRDVAWPHAYRSCADLPRSQAAPGAGARHLPSCRQSAG